MDALCAAASEGADVSLAGSRWQRADSRGATGGGGMPSPSDTPGTLRREAHFLCMHGAYMVLGEHDRFLLPFKQAFATSVPPRPWSIAALLADSVDFGRATLAAPSVEEKAAYLNSQRGKLSRAAIVAVGDVLRGPFACVEMPEPMACLFWAKVSGAELNPGVGAGAAGGRAGTAAAPQHCCPDVPCAFNYLDAVACPSVVTHEQGLRMDLGRIAGTAFREVTAGGYSLAEKKATTPTPAWIDEQVERVCKVAAVPKNYIGVTRETALGACKSAAVLVLQGTSVGGCLFDLVGASITMFGLQQGP